MSSGTGAEVYPTIVASGGPRERGRQYGEAARSRVQRTIQVYGDVFREYAGWDWEHVCTQAQSFLPALKDFEPRYVEEMRGIAEGAGAAFADILALNVRTEVMFGAAARADAAGERLPGDGCSAVALLPEATAEKHTLLAQNWDWLEAARETVVVLSSAPDDGPAYVTVVEAGLLAKAGMNEHGVGVVTNALVCDEDRGAPGVPYHVSLRAVLDATGAADALHRLQLRPRSSSASYVVGSADGLAFAAEGRPGDYAALAVGLPDAGRLFHTNHFISPAFHGRDVGLKLMYDSPFRLQRLQAQLGPAHRGVSIGDVQRALRDHAGHPLGVCSHPDRSLAPVYQQGTVFSLVMDLPERRLWLADGNPCRTPYRELALGWPAHR